MMEVPISATEHDQHQTRELADLLNAVKLGIWEWKPHTDRIHLSSGFYRLTGHPLPVQTPRLSEWLSHIDPRQKGEVKASFSGAAREDGATFDIEFRYRDPSGKYTWLVCQGEASECTGNARHWSVVGTIRGLHSAKDSAAALNRSDRKLVTLMNNLNGLVYRSVNDGDWTMEFVSRGCVRLLGYQPSDIMEKRVSIYHDLIDPEERAPLWPLMQAALDERRPFQFTYRVRTAGGEKKWVWEQGEGVFSDHGELMAIEGFITDITAQRLVELNLKKENLRLRSSIRERYKFGDIIGKSEPMQQVYAAILQASATDANVIIYGESGTGKELVATAIHNLSDRGKGPLAVVNCGAIPENLLESELFGHKKGAFTGAVNDRQGYLEQAAGGTLFLDELGEIGLGMQVKLLRAIEGKGFVPVGGRRVRTPDFRIIGATNRNLEKMVAEAKMREDFYYRVHIIPIRVPPLRARREDIPLLIDHFLAQHGRDGQAPILSLKARELMQNYHWPGNVRELQSVLHRYTTLGHLDLGGRSTNPGLDSDLLDETVAGPDPGGDDRLGPAMAAYEKQLIQRCLEQNRWHKGQTAQCLGITPRTLQRKLKRHDIS